jgi:hypothetical protein
MKDLPHHMKKLNRRIIRSQQREMSENETFAAIIASPPRKQTKAQIKKQAKAKITKERNARTPIHMTEEERNIKMAKRVPVFDRINHATPKRALSSRKKTPRI